MKIGVDARPLAGPRTGIGTYLYHVLEELSSLDQENEYVLYSHKPLDISSFKNPLWRTSYFPARIGTLSYCIKLPGLLKKEGIDVFWGTQHVLPFFNKDIRYLLTILDLTVYRYPKTMAFYNYLVNKSLLRLSVKKAHALLAISESTKRDAEQFLGPLASKPKVVYGAVSKEWGPVDNAEAYLKEKYALNTPYILYLGTIEPRKNLITLLKAYRRALQEGYKLPLLVLAGKKGWKSHEIYRLAQDPLLVSSVRFLGYVEKEAKIHLYNGASFFVFPSLYEGFGLPVLEAMKCGIPVIATKGSSLEEVVGEAGLLFDPQDEVKLKEHMVSLSENEELRAQLKTRGLLQAERFSWKESAQQIKDLLMGV